MSIPTTGFSSASAGRATGGFDPDGVARFLSVASFWFAIALPLVYLPMLAAGIHTVDGLQVFLGLLGLHLLALVGGRGHAHVDGSGQHARVR